MTLIFVVFVLISGLVFCLCESFICWYYSIAGIDLVFLCTQKFMKMASEKQTSSIQKKLEKVSLNERSDSGITLMVPEQDQALNDSDIETAVS